MSLARGLLSAGLMQLRAWGVVCSWVLVCACGSSHGSLQDGKAPVGGSQAGRAPAAGGGAAGRGTAGYGPSSDKPSSVLITVRNDGEVPIVLGNDCGGRWMALEQDAKPMRWDRTCQCECGSPACGCLGVCMNTQKLLVPGQSDQLEWDGTYLSYDQPSCYEPAVPKTGSTLTARICWNQTNDNPTGSCASREFRYGTDTKLELAIKAVAEPKHQTKIVLENHTGGPIEVLKESCGVQGWFDLDLGKEITLNTFCACDCGANFKPSTCPTCGGCAEDVYETIADGASISQTWDGRFSFNRPRCTSRYDMPASFDVLAKACWRKKGSTERVCSPLRFQSGQSAPAVASAP